MITTASTSPQSWIKYMTYHDYEGVTAIFMALYRRYHDDIIIALISSYPDCLNQAIHPEQSLPLHVAISERISPKVIEFMIKLNPLSVRVKDVSGHLPIHLTARRSTPIEVIRMLIALYPDGLKEYDIYHKLPLHICVGYTCHDTIMAILEAYPAACAEDSSVLHGLVATYINTLFDQQSSHSCLRTILKLNKMQFIRKMVLVTPH